MHKNSENREQNSKENKQPVPIEVEKPISSFNLQSEMLKIKLSIPLNKLLRNNEYMETITKMVKNQCENQPDILEVTDDYPTIVLGLKIEETYNEEVPLFYLSLNVHDMILHNAMLYSGASHNIMPRVVVESLGF